MYILVKMWASQDRSVRERGEEKGKKTKVHPWNSASKRCGEIKFWVYLEELSWKQASCLSPDYYLFLCWAQKSASQSGHKVGIIQISNSDKQVRRRL